MSQEYYITDKNGRRIAVQIPIKKYEKLLADAEELKIIVQHRRTNGSQTILLQEENEILRSRRTV